MLRLLAQLLRSRDRPPGVLPRRRNDARLVGFLVTANRKTIDTRWQDLGAAGRRLLRRLGWLLLLLALLWIAGESIRFLNIF